MEYEKIMNDLLSTDNDSALQSLDLLKASMDRNSGILMIGNIKKLYRGFYNVLSSHSFDPVLQCTNLLIEVLKSDESETLIYFSKLIPILVQNLGSTKIPICTATFNCLKEYSSKIGGLTKGQIKPGIVINNLYLGIEGSKTNLDNIKEYLQRLEGSDIKSSEDYDQLEQELIKHASTVAETNLGSLVRGGSFRSTNGSIDSINNSLIDDNKFGTKKRSLYDSREFSGVGKSIIGISEQHRYDLAPYGGSNVMNETNFSQMSNSKVVNSIAYGSDGLAFGVVPKEIIDQIMSAEVDWPIRNMGIEAIFEILQSSNSRKTISNYAPSFMKFIFKIFNEESTAKVVLNLLKIINLILQSEEISNKVNDQTIVSHLIKKFAFSNVQIRRLAMQGFISIMKNSKQATFLNMLLPYLGSQNNHTREEVLHLMIASFLSGTNSFDYFEIVDSIAKLLDDPKSTVRFTCVEALTTLVLKGNKDKVCEILYEIVERQEYNRLCDRFEAGNIDNIILIKAIYILGMCPEFIEDGLIFHFPYHANEVRSRASSRESGISNSSQRPNHQERSGRSKIGDSPLTSKEFSINKISAKGIENFGTFADNYKNGLNPSERMRKFNLNQPQILDKSNDKSNLMIKEYNKNSMSLNNNISEIAREPSYNPDQPKPIITQNLRLLKTKMRLSSASSNESEAYTQNSKYNQFQSYKNDENFTIHKPGVIDSQQKEKQNITIANISVNKSLIDSSSRKQKPIKADHQVMRNIGQTKGASVSIEYTTPKKRESTAIDNPYETTSGKKFMRSTQRSSTGDDDTKYLASDEIEKLANPSSSINQLPIDLASKDWETQVNACNVVRSIALHNSNLLDSTFYKLVLADLIKIASSLRSSVCKNGLLAFQDIFQNCSKHIEFDLESISNILIK